MGYTLTIGEACIRYDEDYVSIDCETVRLDEAPAFGDPTDFTSEWWPGYSAWGDAMQTLDLIDVMFNKRNGGAGGFKWNGVTRSPLLCDHPGVMPITKEHAEYVEDRLAKYKAAHPDHRAEYPPGEDVASDPRYDSALCRGEWLAFWLRWAVENCKQPVFVNS